MKKYIPVIIIILFTALLYKDAVKNKFNTWDDYAYITGNKNIELTEDNIKKSILHGETHGMYAPITALSNSVLYHFFKLNSAPYIFTNLLIHLLNIALLWIFLSLLIDKKWVVLFVVALFAFHPANVEAVAYATGKRDVLFSCFYLSSLIFYVKSLKEGKLWHYILATLFGILALFSKGTALVLIGTLFAIDVYLNQWKVGKTKIWLLIFTLIVAYQIYRAPFQAEGAFASTEFINTNIPLWLRFVYATANLGEYIIMALIPINLSLVHSYPIDNGAFIIPFSYYLLIALTISFVVLFIKLIRKPEVNRLLLFGMLFFVINIALLLQIIPNSYGIINDHYLYFSGIGVFIILGYCIDWIYNKTKSYLTISFAVIYVCVLAFVAIGRINVFRNSFSVWKDVVEKYPNEKFANYNLAVYYDNNMDYDKAVFYYTKTMEFDPLYVNAPMQRAIIFTKNGMHKEALHDLNIAISIKPMQANLYMNRGCVLQNLHEFNESIKDFDKAISLKPSYEQAFINRAVSKNYLGQYESAVTDCDSAIILNQNCHYYYIRGVAEANLGKYHDAISDCKKSLSLGCDEKMVNDLLNKIQ